MSSSIDCFAQLFNTFYSPFFGQRYVLEGLKVALNGKPRLNLDKKKFDGQVEA